MTDHVERAFDLLHHYREALNHDGKGISVEDRERVLQQLEGVLHRWLPMALASNEPLITDVHGAIGHRDKAKQLLAATEAELRQVRTACLQRLAREAHSPEASTATLVANCREEIRRWRGLLPYVRRKHDGQPYVDRADQSAARSVGYGWSVNLDSRPSREGASYFLAAACDAVAAAARDRQLPREAMLPAIRLPLRLRRHPDWARIEVVDVIQVLQEQMELVGGIEDLLAELDLAERDLGGAGQEPRERQPNGDTLVDDGGAAAGPDEQPTAAAPSATALGSELGWLARPEEAAPPNDHDQNAWNPLDAFHRATMAVYAELGGVIRTLGSQRDLQGALFVLDEIAAHHMAPEAGDPELVVDLKHAVGRLRSSLATVEEIVQRHLEVRIGLGRGRTIDRTWGGIGCASYHDIVVGAANALLEVPKPRHDGSVSNTLRRQVIRDGVDGLAWRRLRESLELEHSLSTYLPLPGTSMRDREAPTDPGAIHPTAADLVLDPVEKAIALLLRDGKNPRSTRAYALCVGVSHTTLGRSERWKRAYESAKPGQGDLPEGTKDKEGNLEAWATEVCENCREEPIESTIVVNGAVVRVCEECALKLASRTKPRTS